MALPIKKNYTKKVSSNSLKKDLLYFSNNFDRFNTLSGNIEKTELLKSYRIVVNITSNNVFCTLIDLNTLKTIVQFSAGKCNVQCSKKLLRFSFKIVLAEFFKSAKQYLTGASIVFKFSGPLRLRRFVLNQVFYNLRYFKVSNIFFDIKLNKCFNGCRPPKKRRKKNKGLRIFK